MERVENQRRLVTYPLSEFTPDHMQGFEKWKVSEVESGRYSFDHPSFDPAINEHYTLTVNKRPTEPGGGGRVVVDFHADKLHIAYVLLDIDAFEAGKSGIGLPGETFTAKFNGKDGGYVEMKSSGLLVVEKPTRVIMSHGRKKEYPKLLTLETEESLNA